MAREITQVFDTLSDDGRGTVITKDEAGREYASTREYGEGRGIGWDSKAEATEKATQDSLNKQTDGGNAFPNFRLMATALTVILYRHVQEAVKSKCCCRGGAIRSIDNITCY
jgi:hypothetical protein